MASILINPAITKIYKKSSSNKSNGLSSLETIAEEKSFYLCMKAQKVSSSGLFKNDRVICVDKKSICYYSQVPKRCSYTLQEMSRQTPKISFNHSELHSVEINHSDPKMLQINVLGNIAIKGQIKKQNKISNFKFVFQNEKDLIKYKLIMEKIIENEKQCTHFCNTEDQYISILHNF